MAVCAFVSFRLGLSDGVSVVTGHWQRSVESMGFDTVTVAGELGRAERALARPAHIVALLHNRRCDRRGDVAQKVGRHGGDGLVYMQPILRP